MTQDNTRITRRSPQGGSNFVGHRNQRSVTNCDEHEHLQVKMCEQKDIFWDTLTYRFHDEMFLCFEREREREASGGQKKVFDSLKLELKTFVNCVRKK